MELNLHQTEWDCCVIGNGVTALWAAHQLWSSRKSVLWITSEEPYSPERALSQHGWLWDVEAGPAEFLRGELQGFEAPEATVAFEPIAFDARSSRRFRRFGETRIEWGAHERAFFEKLGETAATRVDLWDWHARLHRFHDTGPAPQGPTRVELASEPRFVRAQGFPLLELRTENGRLTGAVLSGLTKDELIEIRASKFYLGDFDENLPSLIKTAGDADKLAGAIKGKAYRAGFGLRLWHHSAAAGPAGPALTAPGSRELASYPAQTALIPLVVSPEKDAGSHVAGRFVARPEGLESLWMGFLTDEELEDNNEILKKIKQAKRAIERAIPGFAESIVREAVTFEPRMRASDLVKHRKHEALGAGLFSDHYGPSVAAEVVQKVLSGVEAEKSPKKQRAMPVDKPREAEASL